MQKWRNKMLRVTIILLKHFFQSNYITKTIFSLWQTSTVMHRNAIAHIDREMYSHTTSKAFINRDSNDSSKRGDKKKICAMLSSRINTTSLLLVVPQWPSLFTNQVLQRSRTQCYRTRAILDSEMQILRKRKPYNCGTLQRPTTCKTYQQQLCQRFDTTERMTKWTCNQTLVKKTVVKIQKI